ncbi:FadR/GntR family transcriptional regulator [Tersicoccus sp. Bi-70]|uniref:FadR/GntR family transcriptional regulator n=1 Tax=Tersicoccus sp. Bi-70 TaxID=1897634 RepID=UPI000976F19A|nr:FCD domain-containing protein [Tersicoccus sp. Bi-70]OMH30582.1 GntR family transcriptional regulator [Tersicoccus sp. Bi-70]
MPSDRSYQVVLDGVEADLRSGVLSPGDRLPGERALAAKYGISRASVREALRVLDTIGLVQSAVGSGPGSGAIVISDPAGGMARAMRLHMAARTLPLDDIVQSRMLLEGWAARAAADRVAADEKQFPEIEEASALLERMSADDVDRARFHILDSQFHLAVSALAGSAVISTVMDSLRETIRRYVIEAFTELDDWAGVAAELRRQHHGILDAVVAGDGDAAERLARDHIAWFVDRAGVTTEPAASARSGERRLA